jgi:ubiquinol-cytochrome c reductase cytochrome b subunit
MSHGTEAPPGADFVPSTWTGSARKRWLTTLPPEKMLPEKQPSYVASWIYVFGMLTIVAMVIAIVSGVVLTLGGVQWFHESSVGEFFNATHYWSVQLFFLFMVVHLWGKYWMAAWRGKRALTWATGVLAFLTAVGVGFTGYVITTNFNAQWIAFEAKDVMNAIGVGSVFNVTNLGQMVTFHVAPLPVALVVLVAAHVLLVRKHGVVPPIDAIDHDAVAPVATETETTEVAS